MKSRLFVFAIVLAAMAFLYKRLLTTQEKLALTEAERDKLQREQDAMKESFMEANAHYAKFNAENPLPDDPDKKLRVAMWDAIHSANAREILGENHLDFEAIEESFNEEQEDES